MSSRPEFQPLSKEERATGRSSILSWLRLMRLPNVFTAIADVAMGYLFVERGVANPLALGVAAAVSALLYTAGMVLNDVFDVEIDRQERPFRPLPSGQISLAAARLVGFGLLLSGVGLSMLLVSPQGSRLSPLLATALAGVILAYDLWLKNTAVGPLGMGTCRFLNVLLGMSVGAHASGANLMAYRPAEHLAAAGIGIYIVGVTWFARSEATISRTSQLLASMVVMAGGVAALGASAAYVPMRIEPRVFWILLLLLMITVLRRCFSAVLNPSPQMVQTAVKHSILSLIWLDAATAVAVAGPVYGVAIAALLIPALLLGRWIYST